MRAGGSDVTVTKRAGGGGTKQGAGDAGVACGGGGGGVIGGPARGPGATSRRAEGHADDDKAQGRERAPRAATRANKVPAAAGSGPKGSKSQGATSRCRLGRRAAGRGRDGHQGGSGGWGR